MSTTISVRLPDAIAKNLNEIAKITERPKSYFIQKALDIYLKDQIDLQIAIDRLRDVSDPVISLEEMKREFDV